jgi:hypothetical protein
LHDGAEPLQAAAAALDRDLVPDTSPLVTAQVARVEALIAVRAGDAGRAASLWSAAIGACTDAGMMFDAAALTVELFERAPGHAGPPADLQAAIDVLAGLRATPWLARARDVAAAPAQSS